MGGAADERAPPIPFFQFVRQAFPFRSSAGSHRIGHMNWMRRRFLQATSLLAGGAGLVRGAAAQHAGHAAAHVPVQTPDLPRLEYVLEDGVKVFRLRAEVVHCEIMPKTHMGPARKMWAWGYNGSVPGPMIEVVEGDRVRILFENRLPEPTTVHWHGLEIPIEMDGTPYISQPMVEPGGAFTYEFTVRQHGTFFYHSHGAMQEMLGMIGLFVIHPRVPHLPRVDKDYGIILQGWALLPNNDVPNTLAMEFNWLTMNGKAAPATTPLIIRKGERVRIRLVNLGMDHHPIHLHGMQFVVTGTEGGRIPESAWYPGNTVIVGVAQARDIEFVAQYEGDWMLHCHLPHHMMNQMISLVGPMAMAHGASAQQNADAARRRVPGYPQDMMMIVDDDVAKPETWGLARGWTASMMGMMNLVRILPDEKYNRIMTMIREGRTGAPNSPHGGHKPEK